MITQAKCLQYLTDLPRGLHLESHDYRLALYDASATLDAATVAYSPAGEVVGAGYVAGGVLLSGFTVTLDGATAKLEWNDAVWNPSSISARGALLYNATLNRAIGVLDFGATVTSTNDRFRVVIPPDFLSFT